MRTCSPLAAGPLGSAGSSTLEPKEGSHSASSLHAGDCAAGLPTRTHEPWVHGGHLNVCCASRRSRLRWLEPDKSVLLDPLKQIYLKQLANAIRLVLAEPITICMPLGKSLQGRLSFSIKYQ